MEYVIVGDTPRVKGALIYITGGKESAEYTLERMKTAPTWFDKRNMEEHTNIRIECCDTKDAWWKDDFLVN